MKTQAKVSFTAILLLSLGFVPSSVSRFIPAYAYYANTTPSQATAIYYLAPSAINLQHLVLSNSQLRQLATLNDSNAAYQLALRFLQQHDYTAAKLWWQPYFATFNSDQQQTLAEQLVRANQWLDISYLGKAGKLPKGNAKQAWLLQQQMPPAQIDPAYAQQQQLALSTSSVQASSQCQFNVLMMTDHYKGIDTLKQYKQQYSKAPEPAKGSFCFTYIVYVADKFSCDGSGGALKCNWQNASAHPWPEGFDFIVMMSKQGAANVLGGIMHINSSQSYAVFLHELMHFNGFEDEYVLAEQKQQWLCKQQGLVAPNLFIANEVSPPKGWQKSIACSNQLAYKPSPNWSIMQYQTMSLSEQYRELWQKQINQPLTKPIRFSEYFAFLGLKPVFTTASKEQKFSD